MVKTFGKRKRKYLLRWMLAFSYMLPMGESLTVTAHAVYLPRPRIEISGPQGVQATFDWQAASDPVAGRMCTVTLTNNREEY